MLTQFRHHYPQGSLISELIDIDRGLYLVKVSLEVDGVTLATGLAGANTIELAEDRARERAIAAFGLETKRVKDKGPRETGIQGDKDVSRVVTTQPQPTIQPPSPIPQPVAAGVVSENNRASVTNNLATEVVTPPEKSTVEKNIFDQPIVEDTPPPVTESAPPEQLDFNEIRHKIDLEMKRLKWTKEQGRDYLLSTYGKRSRLHLQDDELLEFLHYLENLDS